MSYRASRWCKKFKAPSSSPYSGSLLLNGLLLLPLPYEARHISSTSLYVALASACILKQLPIPFAEPDLYGKNISSIAHGPTK